MSESELLKLARERRAVEYGEMRSSVDSLVTTVAKLGSKVDELNTQLSTGKGLATGLFMSAGLVGGVLGSFAHKLLDVIK